MHRRMKVSWHEWVRKGYTFNMGFSYLYPSRQETFTRRCSLHYIICIVIFKLHSCCISKELVSCVDLLRDGKKSTTGPSDTSTAFPTTSAMSTYSKTSFSSTLTLCSPSHSQTQKSQSFTTLLRYFSLSIL